MPAPASGMDAGTASQLIPGVRRTNGGPWRTSVVATTWTTTASQAAPPLGRRSAASLVQPRNGVAGQQEAGDGGLATEPAFDAATDTRPTESLCRLGQTESIQSLLDITKLGVAELNCERNLATEERGQRTAGRRTRG
jgi:hypothetical protein